ncbi:MAG: carbohydrate binding domain-containing protein [bacterium]
MFRAAATTGVLMAVAFAAAGEATRKEGPGVVLKTGFEEGLEGWRTQGDAQFAADASRPHGGKHCARITVPPGTKPWYQQLRYETEDVAAGDEFQATAWVRSEGVTQRPGAYGALEFLDARGKRAGIGHSPTGATAGKSDWQRLSWRATAPEGTSRLRLSLILHEAATAWFDDVEVVRTKRREPWPDLGAATRTVTVRADDVVLAKFGGVGFHVFHHAHPLAPEHLDQVVAKRWRELRPAFARMNDKWDWDQATLDKVAEHMLRLKDTGTEIYLATWGPKDTPPGPERAAYARRVVDNLEYLIRTRGCTNIKTYCMTNELSLGGWGTLRTDLPKFRDYHQHLHDELRRRGLPVQLLATDASPVGSWHTLEWAAEHMDAITGVYGGHHYFNRHPPDDERFYLWFLGRLQWAAGLARAKGKDFILGEFGCKQDGRIRHGKRWDACIYWDTPTEPLVAIQLAEAAIAALNAGVYALGNWTFMDFPDDYRKNYANKWGVFKWTGTDYATRDHYYAYGLLTRFFRGPATVVRVEASDPRIRAAAIRHHQADTWSIAVVNRNQADVPLALTLEGAAPNKPFRKYVYDPAAVPQHPFGDLQPPAATLAPEEGRLQDTLHAGTLTVYTTAYDAEPPAPVKGLALATLDGGAKRLTWQASPEPDLCYYRLYRAPRPDVEPSLSTRIGSTVATTFVDREAPDAAHYTVVAVDHSGNPVEPR